MATIETLQLKVVVNDKELVKLTEGVSKVEKSATKVENAAEKMQSRLTAVVKIEQKIAGTAKNLEIVNKVMISLQENTAKEVKEIENLGDRTKDAFEGVEKAERKFTKIFKDFASNTTTAIKDAFKGLFDGLFKGQLPDIKKFFLGLGATLTTSIAGLAKGVFTEVFDALTTEGRRVKDGIATPGVLTQKTLGNSPGDGLYCS